MWASLNAAKKRKVMDLQRRARAHYKMYYCYNRFMDVESMRPHSDSKTMNFIPQNLRSGVKYWKLQESRISTLTFFLSSTMWVSVTKEAQFSAEHWATGQNQLVPFFFSFFTVHCFVTWGELKFDIAWQGNPGEQTEITTAEGNNTWR